MLGITINIRKLRYATELLMAAKPADERAKNDRDDLVAWIDDLIHSRERSAAMRKYARDHRVSVPAARKVINRLIPRHGP